MDVIRTSCCIASTSERRQNFDRGCDDWNNKFPKTEKDNKFLKINKFLKFKYILKHNKANLNNSCKTVKSVTEGIKEVRTVQKWLILLHDRYFVD